MLIYLAVIDSPEGKIKFEIIYEQYKNLTNIMDAAQLAERNDY